MIAYEDLALALDRYNRRLRGEVVSDVQPQSPGEVAELDFVEEDAVSSAPPPPPAFGVSYGAGVPDVTAETALPEGSYGQADYAQQGYEQQGYDPDAYAQQQPPVPGSGPVAAATTPYPDDQDPYRQ